MIVSGGPGEEGTAPLASLAALPADTGASVVVPARDAAGTLAAAVASALGQACPGPLEVVLAVGPSSDATTEVASRLALADDRVTVVDNPAGTTPAGLNRAIAASRYPVVVRLDAHAVLPPGYIAHAIDLLASTGAANVGGRQDAVAEGGFARAVADAMASPLGAGGARYRTGTEPGDVDTVYLGVFRREALEAVGGFDERLVRNQDYELNHRLRAAGGRIHFHPALSVAYTPRASVGRLWRQYHDYGRWKRAVLGLHRSSVKPRQLAAPALVVGLLGALLAGLARRSWPTAVAPVGGYVALCTAGGCAASRSIRRTPATAVALMVMHVAWGAGFLFGRRPDLTEAG